MARMMRRDHIEDARHFDAIAANRAKAPETQRLADLLIGLAETHEGDKHDRLASFAGQVQTYADAAQNVDAKNVLDVFEMTLRALGLKKDEGR